MQAGEIGEIFKSAYALALGIKVEFELVFVIKRFVFVEIGECLAADEIIKKT